MRWISLAFLAVLTSPLAGAEEPTVGSLFASLPVISSRDDAFKSIELSGRVNLAFGRAKFRASYRSPDQVAIVLSLCGDNIPVLFASQGKTLIYEPQYPQVTYWADRNVCFDFHGRKRDSPEEVVGGFVPCRVFNKEQGPSEIKLDFKSFFGSGGEGCTIKKVGDAYQLTSPKLVALENYRECDNLRAIATLDPTLPMPLKSFEIGMKGFTVVTIDTIRVNAHLRNTAFKFPNVDVLGMNVKVRTMPKEYDSIESMEGARLFLAAYIRKAINEPESRKDLPATLDWEFLARNEPVFAKKFRETLIVLLEYPMR